MSRLNKIITRAKHKNKARQYIHTPENSFYIVPLKWHSGFIDLSELGNNTNRIELLDQMSGEKVFTGKENLTVLGDQAMELFIPYNGDEKLKKEFQTKKILRQGVGDKSKQECFEDRNFANNQMKSYDKGEDVEKDKNTKPDLSELSRGCGRFFLGAITSNQIQGIYGANLVGEDFLNFTVEESVRVFTSYEINQKDIFDFIYVIPQLTNQFLYIDNVDKVWLETDFYVNSITFRSINKRISKSGKAIDQFINGGAPGDTILKPVVKGNTLIFDSAFMRDVPIKKVQLDFNGLTAFGSIMAMGRPASFDTEYGEGQFSHYLERPRMLLPYTVNEPLPNELMNKKQMETNYYAAAFKLALVDYVDDGNAEWNRDSTSEFMSRWEGTIEPTNKFQMLNSNPVVKNDNMFRYTIFDSEFKFNFNNVNPIVLDARHNPYCKEQMELKQPQYLPTFLCHNYFALSVFDKLPIEKKSIINWNVTRIPLVGGLFGAVSWMMNGLGIPSGGRQEKIRLETNAIPLLMPTIAPTFGSAFKPSKNKQEYVMPLEIFQAQNENDQYMYSGINATSAAFNFTLTDQYYDENNKIRETTELGFTHHGNSRCRPAQPKENGYKLDALNFQALGKSNVGISFFTFGDFSSGSGTFKTNATYTNSLRNGTNTFKLSFYEVFQQVQINYPRDLVEPDPIEYKDLEVDLVDETLKPPKALVDIGTLFNNFSYDNRTIKRDVILYLRRVPGLEQVDDKDIGVFDKKEATRPPNESSRGDKKYEGYIYIKASENSIHIIGEKRLIIPPLNPPPPPPPPPRQGKRIDVSTSTIFFSHNLSTSNISFPSRTIILGNIDRYKLGGDYDVKTRKVKVSNFFNRHNITLSQLKDKYRFNFEVNKRTKTYNVEFDETKQFDTSRVLRKDLAFYCSPNYSYDNKFKVGTRHPLLQYWTQHEGRFKFGYEQQYARYMTAPLEVKPSNNFLLEKDGSDLIITFKSFGDIDIVNKKESSILYRMKGHEGMRQVKPINTNFYGGYEIKRVNLAPGYLDFTEDFDIIRLDISTSMFKKQSYGDYYAKSDIKGGYYTGRYFTVYAGSKRTDETVYDDSDKQYRGEQPGPFSSGGSSSQISGDSDRITQIWFEPK